VPTGYHCLSVGGCRCLNVLLDTSAYGGGCQCLDVKLNARAGF
jgi:hypothetical protein